MAEAGPRSEYERRRDRAREDAARADRRSAFAGNGRVLVIAAGVAMFFVARGRDIAQPLPLYAVLAALLVGSLFAQDVADRRRDRARLRGRFYERALERLAGGWRAFPSQGGRFDDPAHPYARDLDVLGKGSLFQLLDTTRTARGEATLALWLLAAAPLPELERRREAVRALAPDLDARERLGIAGLDEELSRIDEAPLLAWTEGPALFTPTPALVWMARLLPPATLTLLALAAFGVVSYWPAVVFVGAHVAILRRTRESVARLGEVAGATELMLKRLLPLLQAAATQPATTPRLQELVDALRGAVGATRSLERRVSAFQSRANLILAILGPFLLWDFHAAFSLQAWWERSRSGVRGWLEALGSVEALAALATYVSEHPEDPWPELAGEGAVFEATGLGHPLLDADRCVRNDVALAGAGTALLVTGSNMSGKSTLLRAVGLNGVLALAGLPVRAGRVRISTVRIATAMRVADSLQEGASFFLAELRRLKSVVDLTQSPTPVLFLLDEILQGTNSRERSLGARGVVAHLLESGAFGLVSTHDLTLVQLGEQLRERLQYAHFSDQVHGDVMTFDYRLRPGVVQTSNALRLMRAIGLHVEIPGE